MSENFSFFNLTKIMSLSCEYRNVTICRVTGYRVRTPHLKYLGAYETFSFVTCQATQVAQQEELMTSKLVVKTQKLVCKILSCNYARVLLQKDSITPEFWENYLKSFWKFSSYPWMSWKFTGIGHLNYFAACIFSTIIFKCFKMFCSSGPAHA